MTVHGGSRLMASVFSVKTLAEGDHEGGGSGDVELEKVRSGSE